MFSMLVAIGFFVGPVPEDLVRAELNRRLRSHWQARHIVPSKAIDDATFLRRASLDLTGTPPSSDRAREFLSDRRPDKRARLVDELLESPEFADYWGHLLTVFTTGKRAVRYDSHDGHRLKAYLRDALTANTPYGEMVRHLMTAEGPHDRVGAANWVLRYEGKAEDLTGAVGSRFLGLSLQCAQCHDHKTLEPWTEQAFWGLAAYWGRTRVLDSDNGFDDEYQMAVHDAQLGELRHPETKKIVPLRLPGGPEKSPEPTNRRRALAGWVTAHPNFSPNIVNRVWQQLFDSGLARDVDGLDDPNLGEPGEILKLLAADFRMHGTGLKRLLRILVLSDAYQLSSVPTDPEKAYDATTSFATYRARPLSTDQLYRAIGTATGYVSTEERDARREASEKAGLEREGEDRPIDTLGPQPFVLGRTLTLLGGKHVSEAIRAGVAATVQTHGASPGRAHVHRLYLATLSRLASEAEERAALKLARRGSDGLADLLWALVNSAEFLSNH